MARIMDTVRRPVFKNDYVWEYSVPLILTFFVPKNFKTSLKYVQINIANLTAKDIIVSLQKIP